jgi:hypothetical protein
MTDRCGLTTSSGSGSSNTTKTISTDASSRHSNVSTAPSSADLSNQHDESKSLPRKPLSDGITKSPSGFLRTAGRTFSFGQKKHLPPTPVRVVDEPLPPLPPPPPPVPQHSEELFSGRRSRATTASTSTTVTPPKLEEDFNLDLGGDFSKMFGFDKRASVMTIRGNEPNGRQPLGPRSLTGNRLNQPSPIQIDRAAKIDAAPHSLDSQHSNEGLLTSGPTRMSPGNETGAPPVPRQPSPLSGSALRPVTSPAPKKLSGFFGRRPSPVAAPEEAEDEDSKLLKDSMSAVNKFMSGDGGANSAPKPAPVSRYRRDEDTFGGSEYKATRVVSQESRGDDDNLFENSLAHSSRVANRFVARKPSPPRTKVMTPAQFERYRQDKERQSTAANAESPEEKSDDDEEIDYDDDEDEIEKARQQAKQRRKQEAHMAVYRQQMMKVTGEAPGATSSRPSLQMSFSTPNLPNLVDPSSAPGKSPDSEEDEEVPLAILAAHGFPNKARAPTRLSSMMSNPNLRASQQPSYQRPGSVAGDAPPAGGSGRLPAFARNLPKDPFLGAGLVHNPVRESFALGGGAPAPPGAVPPGGLVGVIVNEERSRAMRRGSPALNGHQLMPGDPINGIPQHMMYGNRPVSTMMPAGDQAQMQMAQMQQFMQMQMQFMQMMAEQQGGNPGMRPTSQMPPPSMMGMPNDMGGMLGMPNIGGPDMRHSFMGNGSVVDLPRPDMHHRTMSMGQPSNSSRVAPSIHIQGVGYAPSIAPSERSNVGLPGRYRPVSHMPPPAGEAQPRTSTMMSGSLSGWDKPQSKVTTTAKKSGNASDDDDEEGWAAMKEKREKKRSVWKSKKSFGADIGALIS